MEVIANEKERGRVFLNKLGAADRQLRAAIRLYFLEEDELAIHLVASSSVNILNDLLKHKGADFYEFLMRGKVLSLGRDLAAGVPLSEEFRAFEALLQPVVRLFEDDPNLRIEHAALRPLPYESSLVDSAAVQKLIREFWQKKRQAYNFLKHADRDAGDALDEATVNNEDTILHASVLGQQLGLSGGWEAHWFTSAMFALDRLDKKPAKPRLIWLLSEFSREEIMMMGRKNLFRSTLFENDIYMDDEERQSRAAIAFAKLKEAWPDENDWELDEE